MVILGLDYGEKRIGAAISDELEIAAHPLPDIQRDGGEFECIGQLVRQRDAGLIVVGMPIRMDGTEGAQARKVRGFIKGLKRRLPAVEVATMDERLTTAQAHRALSIMGASMRTRRKNVDRMAAQIILHRYLERRRAERQGTPDG